MISERAQPDGARHRNRRAHAKLPGLVAGGGDDPALRRVAPDRHWLSTQRRIVSLLDGCVERIHVEMQNSAAPLVRRHVFVSH